MHRYLTIAAKRAKSTVRGIVRPNLSPPRWSAKQNALRTAIGFSVVNNVVGDYLEFGVFRGESFIRAYKMHERDLRIYRRTQPSGELEFLSYQRQYFAFDSFEGLPPVEQSALPLHWRGEHAMSFAEQAFLKNLHDAGIPRNRVTTVPGFYQDSLTFSCYQTHQLTRAAIVHVDCDLYESTVEVLDFITPLVVDGTVLVFDDWFYYQGHPAKGEQGAFREWLSRHPEFVHTQLCVYYPAAAFILNRTIESTPA
jgi:O-methyltransferase